MDLDCLQKPRHRALLCRETIIDTSQCALKQRPRAGISHNKLVAKLASAMNKPYNQTVVPARALAPLMATLPLRKIRGLGGKWGAALDAAGCSSAGDVQALPYPHLLVLMGGNPKRAEYAFPRDWTCGLIVGGRACRPAQAKRAKKIGEKKTTPWRCVQVGCSLSARVE